MARATPAEEVLGHVFLDRTLARAVASPAGVGDDPRGFERLEFLGDRVLGLLLAEALWRSFPDVAEGGLAERIAVLASGGTLAEIAEESGLARAVAGGSPEVMGSRRARAGMVEAALAALYLDGGLGAAHGFFERFALARLAAMADSPRDPKMALQEWAVRRTAAPPAYETLERSGPVHRPRFRVRVSVEGHPPEEGSSTTKRGAEKAAAAAMLARVGGP